MSENVLTVDDMHDYAPLLDGVHMHFNSLVTKQPGYPGTPLFRTRVGDDLFQVYLDSIPASQRQLHNCHTCKAFIRRFGGLVCIGEDGAAQSAIWHEDRVPKFYQPAVKALRQAVERQKIDNIAVFTDRTLGVPETDDWTHLAVTLPDRYRIVEKSDIGTVMGKTAENYKTVSRALAEFSPDLLRIALKALNSEKLRMPEKFVGPVQWLLDLHTKREATVNREARSRILWRAIAMVPEGFCHPRQSMVGSLLADIEAGLDFESIKRRFNSKLGPLDYQRPKAAPTTGNIIRAEKLVEKLGIAESLHRRFAKPEEVLPRCIWTPKVLGTKLDERGVFGHLKPKGVKPAAPDLNIPAVTLTWEKFCQKVLPNAESMKIYVNSTGPFCAMTTQLNSEAPSIIKWDDPEARNPFGWYGHHPRNYARDWSLSAGSWAALYGIVPLPTMWGDNPMPHMGNGVIFLVDGMKDINYRDGGNALFPEMLRSELHEVRATIEAFAKREVIQGGEEPQACGLVFNTNSQGGLHLAVTAGGDTSRYNIDRWE